MTFESFAELYEKDVKPKLKLNTTVTQFKVEQALMRRIYEIYLSDMIIVNSRDGINV